jgi:hypothetical protein
VVRQIPTPGSPNEAIDPVERAKDLIMKLRAIHL